MDYRVLMNLFKGIDQSYELNCLSNEAKEGHLRSPTCHNTSPNAIVVEVHSRTHSSSGTLTLDLRITNIVLITDFRKEFQFHPPIEPIITYCRWNLLQTLIIMSGKSR
jgi:hypothetical protein